MNDPVLHFDNWDTALPADARALADRLFPLFYDDLRSLAKRERHRVGAGVTMQTTALVNEAYLKLRRGDGWNTDAHFCAPRPWRCATRWSIIRLRGRPPSAAVAPMHCR